MRRGPGAVELVLLAIAAVAVIARLVVSLSVGLDGDEAYYTMWSAWLQPGYLDHPPAVAVMIWLGRLVAGDTLLGVRLLSWLAGIATLVALYRTGRLLLPATRLPAALTVAWYCLSLQAAIGFVATPDAPSTLFWVLSIWATAEAVTRSRPGWWLAVGVFAGLGLASKYTNGWLGIGLVLYLIATREGRAQLRLWQLWAGGALALLVVSPVIWWNATHQWVSFRFQGSRLTSIGGNNTLSEFIAGQTAVMGPLLLAGALAGILVFVLDSLRRTPNRLALPVLTSLPLLAYFTFHAMHSRVEVNWLAPVTPILALIAVGSLAAVPRSGLWSALATIIHGALGIALIALAYVQAVYHPLQLGIADRSRMLRGWEDLATEVRRLADVEHAQVIWTDSSYRLAGELFFLGRGAGDKRPVRDITPHVRYDFIPAINRFPKADTGLLVRQVRSPEDAEDLAPRYEFDDTRLLEVLRREDGSGADEYYAVFAVSRPNAAFPSAD